MTIDHDWRPYARLVLARLISLEQAACPATPESQHRLELLRELYHALTLRPDTQLPPPRLADGSGPIDLAGFAASLDR